ncbi:MAG: sugar ABC transporter permease, partial [Propionicimonas sp.]|nr:sugar ABC transporter permease [Propionicimonas sp.]
PNYGWLNRLLEDYLGVPGGGLLANPDTAIYVICFVAIWHGVGLPMVLILGGLQDIPKEVVEAARIDGAGNLRIAWSISIPMTKDVIATVTLLQLIGAFKVFDTVQALTRGGPGTATHVFGTLIYRDAFILGDFGYASGIAVVASTLIITVTFLYMTFIRPSKIEKAG